MKTTISAKVSPELLERLEDAKDDGETRSAAISRYLRLGLDAEESDHTLSLPLVLLWFGSLVMAAKYTTASGPPIGIVAVLLGLALMNDRFTDALESIRARLNADESEPATE